ncbi:MAG: hypothetical protein SO016_09270 [Lachnospiraceae bacterium]|nr:hypothetical protein [Robinsoniella sp.]MDY3766860.1 hypothetical protein [Lachnospiraceae bacterium]
MIQFEILAVFIIPIRAGSALPMTSPSIEVFEAEVQVAVNADPKPVTIQSNTAAVHETVQGAADIDGLPLFLAIPKITFVRHIHHIAIAVDGLKLPVAFRVELYAIVCARPATLHRNVVLIGFIDHIGVVQVAVRIVPACQQDKAQQHQRQQPKEPFHVFYIILHQIFLKRCIFFPAFYVRFSSRFIVYKNPLYKHCTVNLKKQTLTKS